MDLAAKFKRASTPAFILGPYYLLCAVLDTVFEERCVCVGVCACVCV